MQTRCAVTLSKPTHRQEAITYCLNAAHVSLIQALIFHDEPKGWAEQLQRPQARILQRTRLPGRKACAPDREVVGRSRFNTEMFHLKWSHQEKSDILFWPFSNFLIMKRRNGDGSLKGQLSETGKDTQNSGGFFQHDSSNRLLPLPLWFSSAVQCSSPWEFCIFNIQLWHFS